MRNAAAHQLMRRFPGYRGTFVSDITLCGRQHSAERLERSALAGAIGADQAHELSLFDGKIYPLHGTDTTVGNFQVPYFEHSHTIGPPR